MTTGIAKEIDIERDVNLSILSPLTLSAETSDGMRGLGIDFKSLTVTNNTVSNTTVETLFADKKTILADSMVIRTCYEFAMWGKLTTIGSLDFIFGLKLNAIDVVNSGLLTQSGNGGWFLKGYFTVRTRGSSGTVQGNAEVGYPDGGSNPVLTSSSVIVDTTINLIVGGFTKMSAASPFNVVTLQQFILKKVA